jgi:hypothetical protein
MASSNLQMRLAICKRRTDAATVHWIIAVVPEGQLRCTYYHVIGGPTQGTSYAMKIEANKWIDSYGIEETHFITAIDGKDLNKLKAAAQRVPLQRCQTWCVGVLEELEKKGLVPPGTAQHWNNRVEPQALPRQSGSGSLTASQSSSNASNQSSSQLTEEQAAESGEWFWDAQYSRYRRYGLEARTWIWQE